MNRSLHMGGVKAPVYNSGLSVSHLRDVFRILFLPERPFSAPVASYPPTTCLTDGADTRLSDSIRVIFYARRYNKIHQSVASLFKDRSYPSSSRKVVLHQVLSDDGMQHYSAELAIIATCNVFIFNATSSPNATL